MKKSILLPIALILSVVCICHAGNEENGFGNCRIIKLPVEYSGDPGSNGITEKEYMKEPGAAYNVQTAEITAYLPDVQHPVPCIVIFPGGGYNFVSIGNIGTPGARFFTSHGIAAVVVKYRLPNGHRMIPITDGQQAIKMVRKNAEEWNIIPDQIGILGSSAGGHLASMLAVHCAEADSLSNHPLEHYSSRPDFVILVKAAIEESAGPTIRNIRGENPAKETILYCNALNFITDRHAPTFIAHCYDDPAAPCIGTVRYFMKLKELGVPAELHVYNSGQHGLGFKDKGRSMDAWMDAALKWISEISRQDKKR